jgi:hypothetical protein
MKTSKKMKLFVQQFVAVVKGDDATALSIKTLREADATLTAQIAVLTGKNVSLENDIQFAEEDLNKAMVNYGKYIGNNGQNYVDTLLHCQNKINKAKDELEINHERIIFLKDILIKINSDVVVEEV